MDINDVIAALSARIGTPDVTATFKSNPCASWGITRWPGPGVDAFVFADSTTRVAIYSGEGIPHLVIAECAGVAVEGRPFVAGAVLNSVKAFDAHKKSERPVIVPLAVAVELAARVMAK